MNLRSHSFLARFLRLDSLRLDAEKFLIGLCFVLVLMLTVFEFYGWKWLFV
jgi:hypothetical protein